MFAHCFVLCHLVYFLVFNRLTGEEGTALLYLFSVSVLCLFLTLQRVCCVRLFYFESKNELKFYNLGAWSLSLVLVYTKIIVHIL